MRALVEATDDWLFLHKPAGVPVFPRHDGTPGPCLLHALLAEVPTQQEDFPDGFAGGIAHRLDVWTSGLVVAARSVAALTRARALFADGALAKQYVFLTDRYVPWDHTEVAHPLAHDRKHKRRMVWQRSPNTPHRGRWFPARTALRRGSSRSGGLARWEATITTGVTHQIRLHAASAGLALLGDRLYGGTRRADGRFFLHARRIDGWPVRTPELPIPEDWP